MKIAIKNQALASIILPPQPTLRELHAANELIFYIEKICGAKLEIGGELENKIIIGGPERNSLAKELISQEDFDKEVPGPEGMMILSKGNMLLLAGSSKNVNEKERGTVYAVYELLERYFGLTLSPYTHHEIDAGEIIPAREEVSVHDGTKYVKSNSDLSYRTAIVQYSAWAGDPDHPLNIPFLDFLVKNRYNRILTWSSIYEGFKRNGMLHEIEKRGISLSVGHHEATALFLPPEGNEYFEEKYYETHPEFYRLETDGSRYFMEKGKFGGQLITCSRNEEGIKTFAENVIKWLDKNPAVDIVCLWPNDGRANQCCCEECKKYSKTANYTYFVSKVAEIVTKVKPYIKFDQIAYVDLFDCEAEKVHPSVIIDQTVWHSIGLRGVGKPDGSCLNGTLFEKTALDWKKAGAQAVYYDYMMGTFGALQRWLPMAEEIHATCNRMKEVGILGLGSQMEVFNMWNHILNFYTFGRTAYDNTLTFEDNLESFSKLFGKGAEAMKEIIRIGEKLVDGQTTLGYAGKELAEIIDYDKVSELYDKALESAQTKREKNNVRLMRMVFRYSHLDFFNPRDKKYLGSSKSGAVDNTGELTYMVENFDSFISGKEGYGIALPVANKVETVFTPDKWYEFK